jgi:alpha-D-ribose 1-methylphosphonate 5-triphosphate diphosphatase
VILTNASVVLPDRVVHASVVVRHGMIADIQPGRSHGAGSIDLDGDLLLPGAVDLHTDNLERQVQPRNGTRWPSRSALLAHDAHCAAAGVTTVLDALCVGDLGFDEDRNRTCAEGVADLTALTPSGLLKAEHYLHLRCELPAEGLLELLDQYLGNALIRLLSLNDHTPGVGQYADLARYRAMRLRDGEAQAATEQRIEALQLQRARLREPNRAGVLARAQGGAVLASHDDRTQADVAENLADGVAVAEFPVTMEAARAARDGGQAVIGGAPNVVRGFSHTGNVAVMDLLAAGLVEALASDYVPASLVQAAFVPADGAGIGLPASVALISDAPARIAALHDRGRIAQGLRADLIRVRVHEGLPVVRQVWVRGERVI